MKYIKITKENIDLKHICCAMSGFSISEKAVEKYKNFRKPGILPLDSWRHFFHTTKRQRGSSYFLKNQQPAQN